MLFLSSPPEVEIQIPDLRTVSGAPPSKPSLEFAEVINDVLLRQDWYRQNQIDNRGKSLAFVGRYDLSSPIGVVAADIRRTLGITKELRQQCRSWKEFLAHIVATAEELGILVFRSAIVRHATRRRLSVTEFRGFVLSDPYAPVIFINDDDARAAQIFTVIHEIAHIWIHQSGITDVDFTRKPQELVHATERFCNSVAAEVLVPVADFLPQWKAGQRILQQANDLARQHRVSTLVILRRAYELGRLPFKEYWAAFEAQYNWFKQRERPERRQEEKKQGGNFWASFAIRNSPTFIRVVAGAVQEGKARYTEAASLLGLKVPALESYLGRAAR